MSQLSPFLRKTTDGYSHWCPGCEEMHAIDSRWKFNGDVNKPSFTPSVKITGVQSIVVKGEWTGEWKKGPDGKPLPYCCHYFLTSGILNFQNDCTHALKGRNVPLPVLPDWLQEK